MDNSGFRREFNQFVFVGLVLIIGSIVVLPVLLALDVIGIVLITVLIIGTVGTGNPQILVSETAKETFPFITILFAELYQCLAICRRTDR